jgi:hypothetical protein
MTLPVYTQAKRKGNIGEAVAQYVLSRIALVHKIDGSNDLGNDFICELIDGKHPANILFYVQVKYCKSEPIISRKTWEYWKGSPIPVFLFWIRDTATIPGSDELDQNALLKFGEKIEKEVSYKRITPIIKTSLKKTNKSIFESFRSNLESFEKQVIEDSSRITFKKKPSFIDALEYALSQNVDNSYLDNHDISISRIIDDYAIPISEAGWFDIFTLAESLKRRGDKQKAKELIEVSRSLITSLIREKYPKIIKWIDSFN